MNRIASATCFMSAYTMLAWRNEKNVSLLSYVDTSNRILILKVLIKTEAAGIFLWLYYSETVRLDI